MTYHISQINNQSSKSAAIVNPHSNPNGRDSRIILPGTTYNPEHPIEVNFIRGTGTVTYNQAAPVALNIYTEKNNWFFWDNGDSALNGVGEDSATNISFYNGPGGNLVMTIDNSANVAFKAA
jgi:hypothetical protein